MKKNKHSISVNEAAIIIGASPQFVRIAMQRQVLDIGVAMMMPGSKEYTYNISANRLAEYSGKNIEEELEKIRSEDFDLATY